MAEPNQEVRDKAKALGYTVNAGDDAVSIAGRNAQLWRDADPTKTLENLKNFLIGLGLQVGTKEFQFAITNAAGISPTGVPSGDPELVKHINKNLSFEQLKNLGIDAIRYGIGKDVDYTSWYNQAGEAILARDPYFRGRMGEILYDKETGLPLYKAYANLPLVANKPGDGGSFNLADFKTVPDWVYDWYTDPKLNKREVIDPETGKVKVESYTRPIPQELVDMGFKPGAPVTPELIEAYKKYSIASLAPELRAYVQGASYEEAFGLDPSGRRTGFGMQTGMFAPFSSGTTGSTSGFSTVPGGTATGFGTPFAADGTQTKMSLKNPFVPGSAAAKAWDERKSAYDILYDQFNKYGLGQLVAPLQGLIMENISPSEFTIRLRETEPYKKRFAANQKRIAQGLRALSEAEYILNEDQYQDIMRRYGLPETYYARGEMGIQPGFEKFIAGDVSPTELEDRIQTAYNRVTNANPEIAIAMKTFYPGITNGDIMAYVLDPKEAISEIKRKVTAAEIGGAAVQAGLTTNLSDAEYLARYGVSKAQAQAGYQTISGYLPRAEQLSSIYGKQVEGGPFTQASAERIEFQVPGAAEELRKRQKITSLEQAAFSGSSGLTGGALGRERAGQF